VLYQTEPRPDDEYITPDFIFVKKFEYKY